LWNHRVRYKLRDDSGFVDVDAAPFTLEKSFIKASAEGESSFIGDGNIELRSRVLCYPYDVWGGWCIDFEFQINISCWPALGIVTYIIFVLLIVSVEKSIDASQSGSVIITFLWIRCSLN